MEQALVGIFAATAFAWFLFYEWPAILDIMEDNPANAFEAPAHWERLHREEHGDKFWHGYRRWWQRSLREQYEMSEHRESGRG